LKAEKARELVELVPGAPCLGRQLELLGLPRSSYYYEPHPAPREDLELATLIDRLYMDMPFYGSRRMVAALQALGFDIGRKRVAKLMAEMGLEAIYPKPRLSAPGIGAMGRYPYLLRGIVASRPNHVWSSDITYIPMRQGHMYLVAVIDWYSRYVLAWRLSNSLDLTQLPHFRAHLSVSAPLLGTKNLISR
jgi:putative transposase